MASASRSGSKNKKAAWEFIKWAVGKGMTKRLIEEHGYPSVCRRSLIYSEAFKDALTLNGQDVASLYLQVLELGGKSGYMKYRTVPQFPQVGDKINKAIERVATGQPTGAEAMAAGAGGGRRRPEEVRRQDRPLGFQIGPKRRRRDLHDHGLDRWRRALK